MSYDPKKRSQVYQVLESKLARQVGVAKKPEVSAVNVLSEVDDLECARDFSQFANP
jgi:hypothetical protein